MADRDDGAAGRPHLRRAAPSPDGPSDGSAAAPEMPPPGGDASPAEASPAEASPADAPPTDPPLAGTREENHRARRLHRIRAWSERPNARLAVPGLLLTALTALGGVAGAVVVPALGAAPPETVPARATLDGARPLPDSPAPTPGESLPSSLPSTAATPLTPAGPSRAPATAAPQPARRPSDVLAGWAVEVGNRVGIPPAAMQAYGYAELVLAQTSPGCHLSWPTLAAIGSVESNHGRANGAVLGPDGQALPQIIGLPLDGQGGRQRIADTDRGQLDGDPVLDRAVGPMQFIPSTWLEAGVDADNDGANNPHDIDDAALAAANYLCGNGRDLATARDWWAAILSYNDVRRYAQSVFDTANRYGAASRT